MNEYKTHTCNEISLEDVGKKVRIAGWVQTIRDLGGLVFLDIRDMYGITQVVTSGKTEDVDFASHIPIESTVTVYGTVKKRDEETVNPKLKTGLVEIKIEEIKVLGKRTKNLPFEVNTNQEIREDLRLQYRYLDLRNERLQNNLKLRAQVLQFLRNQMQEQGFLEVQTPILTSSSPEGARDYLVPSRLHPGKFYALPQAPQQFKQLLMVSGIDKYFQIIPLLFKLFAVVLENRLQAIGNFLCDIGRNLLHIRVALQIRTGYIQRNIRRIEHTMQQCQKVRYDTFY